MSLIFPVDLGDLGVGHGSVGRRLLEVRRHRGGRLGGRNHQRLLLAQRIGQQAKGRDLAGRVHPDLFLVVPVTQREHGDDVVELRGRRNVGIELAAGIDEHRPGVQAFGLKQRGQQRVLVFAVAVLVVEHVGGGMRLVAADSERKADVAEVLRDEIVECFGFFEIAC